MLILAGAGFDVSTTVQLVAADNTVYSGTLKGIITPTQITATFAAGTVPVGKYSVRVSTQSANSVTLPDAFQVLPAGQAKFETNIVLPSALGVATPATIYLEYSNTGTLAMPAPLVALSWITRICGLTRRA